jgi:glucan 1,3-beta-glucosidase
MQNNPSALSAHQPLASYSDPSAFQNCFLVTCAKTYGLAFYNSTFIFNYGAGLYSFFNNYDSGCLTTTNCQQYMVTVEKSQGIYLYGLNTVGVEIMVEVDGVALVPEGANGNSFSETVGVFEYP